MNRSFHLVDYKTEMTPYCPSSFLLNTEFTVLSQSSLSLIGDNFNTFNFNNLEDNIYIQQLEELNPVINYTTLNYRIFPKIFFTIPNGFVIEFISLIPGINVKHVISKRKNGLLFNINDEIILPKTNKAGIQRTRISGAPDHYHIQYIEEIMFEIETDYIKCTKTGFEFLRDNYPETDILNINFRCLNKILPENYEDIKVPDPRYGCDKSQYYYNFHVIKCSTLFNYIYK